jgi:hypothetical protein
LSPRIQGQPQQHSKTILEQQVAAANVPFNKIKLREVAHTCNPSTQGQGDGALEANLCYRERLSQKNKQQKQKKEN